jgi:hypothetical protein
MVAVFFFCELLGEGYGIARPASSLHVAVLLGPVAKPSAVVLKPCFGDGLHSAL